MKVLCQDGVTRKMPHKRCIDLCCHHEGECKEHKTCEYACRGCKHRVGCEYLHPELIAQLIPVKVHFD